MPSSHRHQQIPTSHVVNNHATHPRPTTAPASVAQSVRPELDQPTVMASGSSSHTDEDEDLFEYLGCSNCTDDLSRHRASQGPSKPKSFWLMECGHLVCARCLGFPDGIDPALHYQCPIRSCGGFRSAVYELNRDKQMHPSINEFFESPHSMTKQMHSMTKRMDTVLSFQNRQLKLRIKNLKKLVQVHKQSSRQKQASSDQQIHDLKRQVRDLKLQSQQHLSGPSNQLPLNLDQSDQHSKTIKRRSTLDLNPEHGAQGNIPRGLRTNSHHQQSFHEPRNLPQVAPVISRPQSATSFNSTSVAPLTRTTSRRTNPGERTDHVSNNGNPPFNANRRQRTSDVGQVDDRRIHNHRLGAIPEDEDQPFQDELRVAGAPSRREPMKQTVGDSARPTNHLRSEQQFRIPLDPRSAYGARIKPMPMPTPSRVASTSSRAGQPIRRQGGFEQPRRASNQAANPVNIAARQDSRVSTNSPFGGFVYHPDADQPTNDPLSRPNPRPSIPFSKRGPPENFERGTPSKKPNPFDNRHPVPPRFQTARGHP
ncbi:hypothetical protein MJO28_007051 [Puccinia striiformis f. sp. tritici]|uniref:RING-type domain-containing protein n=2 Tax=Puccinia striiformis TaxID=27350 RepID=A0A2S4WED6_9BASI|nr:hypothetical protein MJO28_007051 [Puccinia striiformis f. sp. tritici]KAI7955609.1 hypothetical protein MJO29_007008 [Puccinia striiformis f. sp. tritici]POW20140.1 hypothetical protein PSHT_03822 [Puccinia striiformis]